MENATASLGVESQFLLEIDFYLYFCGIPVGKLPLKVRKKESKPFLNVLFAEFQHGLAAGMGFI